MLFDKCALPWCDTLTGQPGHACQACQELITGTVPGPVRPVPFVTVEGAVCLCGCSRCAHVSAHCLRHGGGCHVFWYRHCQWRPGQPPCSEAVREEASVRAVVAYRAERDAERFWLQPYAPKAATARSSLAGCPPNAKPAAGRPQAPSSALPAPPGSKAPSS